MKADFNSDILNETTMIQQVIGDISKLIQAHKLLEQVWLDIGAYGMCKVKPPTLNKIQDYFNFDDSE